MRQAAKQGLKLALVTNASCNSIRAFLVHGLRSELNGVLDLVVEGGEGWNKKPAPDLYLRALQELSLQPEECVAIEDSASGLKAATQAGIVTVVTVNQYTIGQSFEDAALVVDSLGEPGAAFKVLQGSAGDARWVTPELL
jgi:beta-phosphoglucomutase-like phosphatase (HAD superfamily)